MMQDHHKRRVLRPLDSVRLEELALAYVARFATTQARLGDYLRRKLRERGWDGEDGPDVGGIVARYVDAGYVDDEVYARARQTGLLRRGYGRRRIADALNAAGIDDDIREALAPEHAAMRKAAVTMARKRRLGPYCRETLDRALREKQLAAMLRAGHDMDLARQVINAESIEAVEEWAQEEE